MVIWISLTSIGFFILVCVGVVIQIAMNITAIIFNVLMFAIFTIGTIIYIYQIANSSFGATKLTAVLSIISAIQTHLTIVGLQAEFHWELTAWKIIVCGLIFIAVIVINLYACALTDEKRNNFKMCLITLGVIAAVAVSGYTYFVHKDKILAKDDIEEIHSYIVTSYSAKIYNVEKKTAWSLAEQKKVEYDAIGDDVIGTCYKGDILTSENPGVAGTSGPQKIRTDDGIVGFVHSISIEPYEYTTRYQLEYE